MAYTTVKPSAVLLI